MAGLGVSEDESIGFFIEDLSVGMTSEYARTITEADVWQFSEISGDTNPLHLNHDYAVRTKFGGPAFPSTNSARPLRGCG
jgi:acyl dehydratase